MCFIYFQLSTYLVSSQNSNTLHRTITESNPDSSDIHRANVCESQKTMCPLRFILVFLSATLAGFFVLRNLRSHPHTIDTDLDANKENNEQHTLTLNNATSKVQRAPFSTSFCLCFRFYKIVVFSYRGLVSLQVRDALQSGFWTFLDMASGRYLWRHLVSSSFPKPE